jgi:hypothetical protein
VSEAYDALVPVATFFPNKERRWISDACRGVKPRRDEARRPPFIPNAIKVGKTWMMRRSDFEAWIGVRAKHLPLAPPSVDDALADLRKRGVV